jgi:methylmalonyl-CoA/ethylmalonyl-CoA epimerase
MDAFSESRRDESVIAPDAPTNAGLRPIPDFQCVIYRESTEVNIRPIGWRDRLAPFRLQSALLNSNLTPFPKPMNNDELRELNKRRKIHQIAWVTRDLERSMKAWVDNLKVGPWTVLTFTEKTLKYLDVDGRRVTEPFKFLIGISWIGEIQVELIQPVYGPMIYEAFIQKHGEGLHHFKERISQDAIDEVLKEYKEKGIEVTQTGQFKEDFHYYLNTEPRLDFVLELGNCPLLNLPKDEFPTYPPEKA